jgi:hypothetical protein
VTKKTKPRLSPRMKRSQELDALERRVIQRFNRQRPPASFQDLITEGLLTPGEANTMRDRLRDRLVVVGKRPNGAGRGPPHLLLNVAPKQ